MSSRQGRGRRRGAPPRTLTRRCTVRTAVRLGLAVLGAAVVVAAAEGTALTGAGRHAPLAGWVAVDVLAAGALATVPLALLLGGGRLARRHAEALRDLAVDDLTGVRSRRAFGAELPDEVVEASPAGRPLTLGLVELTGMIEAIEVLGRRRAEALVRAAAATLVDVAGSPAYRLWGEVFAVVLPGTGPDAAFELADGVLDRIARAAAPLSAVAGLCTLDARCPDAQLLLVGASAALDEARALGPGRVVASADSDSGLRWVATPGAGHGTG